MALVGVTTETRDDQLSLVGQTKEKIWGKLYDSLGFPCIVSYAKETDTNVEKQLCTGNTALVGVFGKRHWANSHAFDKTKWKFEKDLNLVPSDYCLWCRTNCHNVIYLSLKRSSCQNTFVFFNYICSGRVGYIWVDFAPEIDILFTLQNFKHIMKELQGAIIISSAFQAFIGYSGLMTLILRYEYLQSKMDLVFAPRC